MTLGCDRESDCATARSEIDDSCEAVEVGEHRQRMFDCKFGLGTWNEHTFVDEQVEMAKCPTRHHILQGFARESTHQHRVERGHHRRRRRFIKRCREFRTVETTRVLAQPPRLVRIGEADRSVREDVTPRDPLGHHTELAWANCSIWYCAVKASITGSRSPASAFCS